MQYNKYLIIINKTRLRERYKSIKQVSQWQFTRTFVYTTKFLLLQTVTFLPHHHCNNYEVLIYNLTHFGLMKHGNKTWCIITNYT